jgi:hypothetical protein
MDCRRCAEDLTAFMDGELSAEDAWQVRAHLDSCTSCAGELRSLQESADFIESHRNELDLRAGSWNLVRARISTADSSSPNRFFSLNRLRMAMAALAIIAALGYLQYQQVQRRNLDRYISQYLEERKAHGQARAALADSNPTIVIPYADNPFIEVNATLADNPFRLEDR